MILHHMEVDKIDIGLITETWINNTIDQELVISQSKNAGYTIISHEPLNRKGGGVMCIYKSGLKVEKVRSITKKSFEGLIIRFQQTLFALIYRPPYSRKHSVNISTFLNEFGEIVSSLLQENSQTIIIGDINVPWNLTEHTDTKRLIDILNTFDLTQVIDFPTHKAGNDLDWTIHKEQQNYIHNLTKLEFLPDHCIIEWTMKKAPSIEEKREKQTSNLKNINTERFKIDLKNKLDNIQRNINTDEMYGNYIDTITSTLDQHTPISRRRCTNKQHKSWFDGKALKFKIQRRKSENFGIEVNVSYTKDNIY